MKVEELIKKMVQTGVGLAGVAAEKLEDTVRELVSEGKMSTEDGKKIVSDFLNDTSQKRSSLEAKVLEMREQVKDKLKIPTKKDVKKLSKRIKKLEKAVAKLEAAQKEADS